MIRDNAEWFNKELLKAKRKRRKLEERWKREKNRESRALYNKGRNDFDTLIEKTKRNYYSNALKNNKDPRMLNKNLNDLLGLKKEKVCYQKIIVTTWILQTNLCNFLMIKQIKYTGVS